MTPEEIETERAKPRGRRGAANNMWKGGRSVASNGYVLIRVGKDHHLADVRGYAYEHRLAAEEKIGRRLRPGEQVHHVNGNRQDNRPENIEVKASLADHFVEHRKPENRYRLRMPGEPNPMIECECGCGGTFSMYDSCNRPRRFISGHNPPAQDTAAIVVAFCNLPRSISDVSSRLNKPRRAAIALMSKLCRNGRLDRVSHGVYQSAEGGTNANQDSVE